MPSNGCPPTTLRDAGVIGSWSPWPAFRVESDPSAHGTSSARAGTHQPRCSSSGTPSTAAAAASPGIRAGSGQVALCEVSACGAGRLGAAVHRGLRLFDAVDEPPRRHRSCRAEGQPGDDGRWSRRSPEVNTRRAGRVGVDGADPLHCSSPDRSLIIRATRRRAGRRHPAQQGPDRSACVQHSRVEVALGRPMIQPVTVPRPAAPAARERGRVQAAQRSQVPVQVL